jgi:5'(3')-deoxyribonucleotidase
MRILCDLDGVVVDFWGPVLSEHNARTGERLAISDITSWSFPLEHVWGEAGFFDGLPLLQGAKEGLSRLKEQGHDVVLVSAGKREALAGKSRMIEKLLPSFRDACIFTNAKTPKALVSGDALVDDGPHNIVGFGGLKILCEYPYATPEARRAADLIVPFAAHPGKAWDEIVKYFNDRRTR